MSSEHPIIKEDLEAILKEVAPWLAELRGQSLFITGGTGFFGQWLLDTIALANSRLDLNIRATVLTRNIDHFASVSPLLAQNPSIDFIEGDIQTFGYPEGEYPYIIHAATTRAEETFNDEDALRKYDTVARGTRHLLDFAVQAHTQKILWTSSGALYGPQPQDMSHIPEGYKGGPDQMDPDSAALGMGKQVAEFQCAYYAKKYGIEIKIARCFTFLGPRMQMDIHYAIGNFIMDVISGRDIIVKGDGTPVRSYMYISDLVIWLWKIFLQGQSLTPYNVGSDESISIGALATQVAHIGGKDSNVRIMGHSSSKQVNRYIPSIQKAREILDLHLVTSLDEAIERTLKYQSTQT